MLSIESLKAKIDDKEILKGLNLNINPGDTNSKLIIIEIQFGEYLGEDDIIRYEDDFNRV